MTGRILEAATTPVADEDSARPDETKGEAFKRLATKRVTVAMDKIRLVGNLSSRGNYDYTPEQVDAIEAALVSSIVEIMRKFRNERAAKKEFTL